MKHKCRYMVIFDKWNQYDFHEDKVEYDDFQELNDDLQVLVDEVFSEIPHPKLAKEYEYRLKKGTPVGLYQWDWGSKTANEYLWGYAVLDFEKEEVIKWGGDNLRNWSKFSNPLRLKDTFFRGEDEIPIDYKWDSGEYEGWLQFRWGDGKNAIDYVPTEDELRKEKEKKKCEASKKCGKKRFKVKVYNELEEAELDKLNEKLMNEAETNDLEKIMC